MSRRGQICSNSCKNNNYRDLRSQDRENQQVFEENSCSFEFKHESWNQHVMMIILQTILPDFPKPEISFKGNTNLQSFSTAITERLQIQFPLDMEPWRSTHTQKHTKKKSVEEKCRERERMVGWQIESEHAWLQALCAKARNHHVCSLSSVTSLTRSRFRMKVETIWQTHTQEDGDVLQDSKTLISIASSEGPLSHLETLISLLH